jgi:hypothetical protein
MADLISQFFGLPTIHSALRYQALMWWAGYPRMVRNIGFVAFVSGDRWDYKTNIFHSWLPFLWLLSFG